MGFFSYFVAREIGRTMSAGERRQMAKFKTDMEKQDAAMALAAEQFMNKVRYRSILGHPEFLRNKAADPDRWWERLGYWAGMAFNTVARAFFAFAVGVLLLALAYAIDETWLNGFTFIAAMIVVVVLTHGVVDSHLWRPVVRWVNWQFEREGWPVERMLAELKVEEQAERAAAEAANRAANRPLRPVKYQADPPLQTSAVPTSQPLTKPRSLGELRRLVGGLLHEAEMDNSLDARMLAVRAVDAAGWAADFAPHQGARASESPEWREIRNVVEDIVSTADAILARREHDGADLMQLLLVLSLLLNEADEDC